jgi:hypothetical protein
MINSCKELHRLSTTPYESLSHAFQDHLITGRRMFGLSAGSIMQGEKDILAEDGDAAVPAGLCIATPIIVESELFATLSFSSGPAPGDRIFSSAE